MAIGTVLLQLGMVDKEFKKGLSRAESEVKKSIDNMKNIIIAAKLGSLLFSAASNKFAENLKLVQIQTSAIAEGLSQTMIDKLAPLVDQFDYIGIGADQASEALYKFILTGRAMALNQLGIYLDKNTQSMLAGMSAAERYEWALQNIGDRLQETMDKLDPTTKAFYELQKKWKDIKEGVGVAMLSLLNGLIERFGGISNVLKTAIIAFTAYKTAMIIGNMAIAISKVLAQGGFFGIPAAIALGTAGLTSLLALGGGAGLAIDALNKIPEPNASGSNKINQNPSSTQTIVVVKDKFGEVQQSISRSSGGRSNSLQTNFGSSN